MIREVDYNGQIIQYELTRKRVKNINLRIGSDLKVKVSANPRVSLRYIDSFVLGKAEFILKAINNYREKSVDKLKTKYSAEEFLALAEKYCDEVYNSLSEYNIDRPQIKFRSMKSRWGSCNFVKCVITLNSKLIYCDEEMIYYVIVHEFSHLIVPNHSKDFYKVVEKLCPDYRKIRKAMGEIII